MRRIAFTRLLIIVIFVPVVVLTLFAGRLTYEQWLKYRVLTAAEQTLRLAVTVTRFVSFSFPAEGGAERNFLSGSGTKAQLDERRRITDEGYKDLRAVVAAVAPSDAKIVEQLKTLDSRLGQQPAFRAKIDSKAASFSDIAAFRAPIANHGIDLVGRAAVVTSDETLSRRIFGLYALMKLNSASISQRNYVQQSLLEGLLPPNVYVLLVQGTANQDSFGKLVADYALPDVVAQRKVFQDKSGADYKRLQDMAVKSAGQKAPEADVKAWVSINQELLNLDSKLVGATADAITTEAEQMIATSWRNILVYFGLTLFAIVAVLVLSRMVVRILRDLLGQLGRTMEELRDGHYEVTVPSIDRRDEIGVMARATENFRDNLVRMRALESEQRAAELRAADDRRLTEERAAAEKAATEEKATAERKAAMHALAGQFESAVGDIIEKVSSAANELETAAGTLTRTAEVTQGLAGNVAAASEQASANVQSVASASEEMSSSVDEIGRQVQASSQMTAEAVKQALATDARISELSHAASRIGDVVKLITAVAEQTNLLALNATIEAARAGEAGKGFAVVASEVKLLAAQTAKATEEISAQVAGMQAATGESVKAIKEIGATIGQVNEIAAAIAAAVEEQGAATGEIARNVQQAAKGTGEVASHITDVNRGAAETGAASGHVLASARALARESGVLKREVETFLATVRAA
jgi:methyl-accepting chemotaxis protein